MIEILGTVALWLLALALVGYAALNLAFRRELTRAGLLTARDKRRSALGALAGLSLIALLLTGCANGPPVETRVQRELVPVATKPIKAEQVPRPVAPLPPRPESPSAAADVLLSAWCKAVKYMLQADPLLRLSAGIEATALQRYPECETR